MRIALQIFTADKRRGGMERYTHDLAAALLRRGQQVTTIATTFAADWPGERRVIGVRGSRSRQYATFAAASIEADIVHAMQPVEQADVYTPHSGFAPRLYQRGNWLHRTANHFNSKRRLVRSLEHRMAERRPLVACLSGRQMAELRECYGRDVRSAVLHHGVNVEHFDSNRDAAAAQAFRRKYTLPNGVPIVLFIAQDFTRKRLSLAIDCLTHIANAHLVVVGRDDPSPWRGMAKSNEIDHRVHFVGEVADTYAAHAAADALILPTLDEPFGLVVLESIAMGNPVVLYETAGAAEVVQDGETGHIVTDAEDDRVWAAALDNLLERRPAWRKRCLAARKKLSFDTHVDALLRLYAQVR